MALQHKLSDKDLERIKKEHGDSPDVLALLDEVQQVRAQFGVIHKVYLQHSHDCNWRLQGPIEELADLLEL